MIKTERLYDIEDLLKLTAVEVERLDSRVTSANGRPGRGDRVVITSKATGEDVSVALNDFEIEALLLKLDTAYPDTRCNVHRPYQRNKRLWFDGGAACTCTKVFSSRLLNSWADATANAMDMAAERHGVAANAWLRSEERWPGALQDSLFAQDKAS